MIKKILLIVIISLFLFIIIGIIYIFYPHYVKIYESYEIKTDRSVDNENAIIGHFQNSWWHFIGPETKTIEENNYNIKLPEIDINNYAYLLSGGRKLIKLRYNLFGQLSSDFNRSRGLYNGTAILSKEWYPNTLFFYKVKKNSIYPEDSNTILK